MLQLAAWAAINRNSRIKNAFGNFLSKIIIKK
jgi:hypothetical protein